MRNREWRYWYNRFEWCDKCNRNRATNRAGNCVEDHPRNAWMRTRRLISGCLRKGAHPVDVNFTKHAQIANLLKEWHEDVGSWSCVARAILDPFDNVVWTHKKRKNLERVTSLLNAEANGNVKSKEVMRLLGVQFPTRHRLHVECGYGEPGRRRKSRVEAALRARGFDSLTEFVLAELLG